jgi:hypothetical protein
MRVGVWNMVVPCGREGCRRTNGDSQGPVSIFMCAVEGRFMLCLLLVQFYLILYSVCSLHL